MKKLLLLALACQNTYSVSLVYNLKIRRSFSISAFLQTAEEQVFWLFTGLPIIYARDRHIVVPALKQDVYEKNLTGGAILNGRCLAPRNWWLEVTTGVEKQTSKYCGTSTFNASRTGLDDIVFSVGKNFLFYNNALQFVTYAITGFPTRTKVSSQEALDPLIGTRFFSLGAGGEISYGFIHKLKRSLTGILQARFIHFFDRSWSPILPCTARVHPGNLTDIFAILQYREKTHIFEVGYNPTFFTNQSVHLSSGIQEGQNVMRNSFYANYAYAYKTSPILRKPGLFGFGFNIGRANLFDTKITAAWINVSILL